MRHITDTISITVKKVASAITMAVVMMEATPATIRPIPEVMIEPDAAVKIVRLKLQKQLSLPGHCVFDAYIGERKIPKTPIARYVNNVVVVGTKPRE